MGSGIEITLSVYPPMHEVLHVDGYDCSVWVHALPLLQDHLLHQPVDQVPVLGVVRVIHCLGVVCMSEGRWGV